MPRRPEGERPLTQAERQARKRQRKAEAEARMREALEAIRAARSLDEAQELAEAALN